MSKISKATILYLDDEIENLENFKVIFFRQYNILTAINTVEAEKLLHENPVQVVLSDQRMPGTPGLEFLKVVAAKYPDIICMIISAFADMGTVMQAINQGGVYRFLQKPWTRDEMIMAIDNALGTYNLKVENKQLLVNMRQKNEEITHAFAQLKDSQDQYKRLVDNINDMIGEFDENGVFLFANQQHYTYLGYSPEELIGQSVVGILSPENAEQFTSRFAYVVANNLTTTDTWSFKHVSGEKRWLECKSNFYYTNAGELRVVIISRDVSVRKMYEDELVSFNEELLATTNALRESENRLRKQNNQYFELNAELSASYAHIKKINEKLTIATKKAEESDNLKTAFLSNMSHEIRTPLNAIVGFSQLLYMPDLSHDKVMYYVDIINSSCDQLLKVLTDIIDISKIETGQIEVREMEVNLSEIIVERYNFHHAEVTKKGLAFRMDAFAASTGQFILTDAEKLMQILDNLIYNAIKFTAQGHIRIGCKLAEADKLLFYVEDTGIGIAEDHQQKIFENFSQADDAADRKYEGTGLGLSIARGLIRVLGGDIFLKSKPGKGATFSFTIPYKPIDLQALVEQGDQIKVLKTILIAEDTDVNFFLVEELLAADYKLLRAVNGREAVDLVAEHSEISLVLMDIKMPVMDGYQALELIKKTHPDLPIVALTAYAISEDRDRGLKAGFDDYLSKPVKKHEIMQVLQRILK